MPDPTFTPESPVPTSRPPLTALRYRVAYCLALAAVVAGFAFAMQWYRGWIDAHQFSRPRYAAERALAALAAGDADLARFEVGELEQERPLGVGRFNRRFSDIWEGAILRNRVQVYHRLGAALLDRRMLPEAETVLWKSVLEFHLFSRTVELLEPWEMLALIKGARQDWASTFEIARILAAHGAESIRLPGEMEPVAFNVDPAVFDDFRGQFPQQILKGLHLLYEQPLQRDYQDAINIFTQLRTGVAQPEIRHRLEALVHRILVESGRRAEARAFLQSISGRDPSFIDTYWRRPLDLPPGYDLLERDPSLLELLWHDRPDDTALTVSNFFDSFINDRRVDIIDLPRLLEPVQTGYFNPSNAFTVHGDSVLFSQNAAGRFSIELPAWTYQLAIAFKAEPALGLYPILLLQIDSDPYIPIYCAATGESVAAIDVSLPPGPHIFTLLYINDAAFDWRDEISENRNLQLFRIGLVHIQRPD